MRMPATAPRPFEKQCTAVETAAPSRPPSRFLGRQPILDADRHLFGYELIYRAGNADHFSGDREQATREVVDHWLMLIPDQNPAASFVNCTRTALVDGLITLLPLSRPWLKSSKTSIPIPR